MNLNTYREIFFIELQQEGSYMKKKPPLALDNSFFFIKARPQGHELAHLCGNIIFMLLHVYYHQKDACVYLKKIL